MRSQRPAVRRRAVRRAFSTVPGRPLPAEMFPAYAPLVLWAVTGAIITLLGLRFAMRFVGVRGDVPVPGVVYSITSPLVGPLYGAFPASNRYDYPAVEMASLAAAGIVIGVAVVIYAIGLVASAVLERRRTEDNSLG